MKKCFLICLVLLFIPTFVFATKGAEVIVDGVDISGLTADNQAQYLRLRKIAIEEAQKKMAETSKNKIAEVMANPSNIELAIQWRTLIVTTLRETAADLNFAVNEFVKTPVGAGVAIVLLYNLMGKTVIHGVWTLVVIPITWIVLTIICGSLFFYFHGKKKVPVEIRKSSGDIEKTIQYVKKYEFRSHEGKIVSVVALTIPWAIYTICSLFALTGAF
jgi:hypothetical protein